MNTRNNIECCRERGEGVLFLSYIGMREVSYIGMREAILTLYNAILIGKTNEQTNKQTNKQTDTYLR